MAIIAVAISSVSIHSADQITDVNSITTVKRSVDPCDEQNLKFDLSELFCISSLSEEQSQITFHSLKRLMKEDGPNPISAQDSIIIDEYSAVSSECPYKYCTVYEIITEIGDEKTCIAGIIFDPINIHHCGKNLVSEVEKNIFSGVAYNHNIEYEEMLTQLFQVLESHDPRDMLHEIKIKLRKLLLEGLYDGSMMWDLYCKTIATIHILEHSLLLVSNDEIIRLLHMMKVTDNLDSIKIKVMMAVRDSTLNYKHYD